MPDIKFNDGGKVKITSNGETERREWTSFLVYDGKIEFEHVDSGYFSSSISEREVIHCASAKAEVNTMLAPSLLVEHKGTEYLFKGLVGFGQFKTLEDIVDYVERH